MTRAFPPPARLRFTALLCAWGLVAGVAHESWVQHEVCAAHGERLHPGHAERTAPTEPDASVDARALADDAHHHCAQVPLQPTPHGRPALSARTEPLLHRMALTRAAAAHEQVTRFLLAPKSSPPARA